MVRLLAIVALLVPANVTGSAQPDPSTLPLLQQSDLGYLGGFRLPAESLNGVNFDYGGGPIAYNPVNNSLFVGANSDVYGHRIAEISIPTPVNTTDAKAMPAATYVQQAFTDPTEGQIGKVSGSPTLLYGLLVSDRLYGTASIYYDASNSQRVSHYARSLSLTTPSFSGWSQLGQADKQGLVSGWMAHVPVEWQAKLGGPAITGQCCIPIISRTSYGPSAFAFNPALIGQPTVPVQPLVYYDSAHRTLGPWEQQNPTYGMTTRVGGVAIIAGTRTALYVGSTGLGQPCYGVGTADKAAADASPIDNICFDPADSAQGNHAYPYRYQIWAYDLNDWAAVKAGTKQPWEVIPYGVWPFTLPTPATHLQIGGVGYDAQRQILYVSQRDGNKGNFSTAPVIHAFKVNATAVAGATYYVSLTGSDTNPGTLASPFRTVKRAVRVLQAGDTLLIRGGTYFDRFVDTDFTAGGTATAPITVSAYPGETVVIKNGGTDGITGFMIAGREYIVIKNMTLDSSDFNVGNVMNLFNNNVTLENLEITGAWANGILGGGSGHRFINLKVHHNGRQPAAEYSPGHSGVYMAGDNTQILGGEYTDNACYGIRFVDSDAAARSETNIVRRALVARNGYGKGLNGSSRCGSGGGGVVIGDTNNTVEESLVHDNLHGVEAIGLSGKIVEGAKILNNVICRNVGRGIGFGQWSGATGTQILNNLVCQNSQAIENLVPTNTPNTVITGNTTTFDGDFIAEYAKRVGTPPPPPPPTNTTPPAPQVDPRITELQTQLAERDARLALIKTTLQQALVQAPRNTAKVVKDAIVKALSLIQ